MDSFLSPRLLTAVNLAVRVHGNMKRKGDGLPFIVHPIAVFGLLSSWGVNEDARVAGLLHDVLEDAPEEDKPGLRAEMLRDFGEGILRIIDPITEDESLPWLERKRIYMDNLRTAPEETCLVSCADQTHNTRALLLVLDRDGEAAWSRFTAPKDVKIGQMRLIRDVLAERLGAERTAELSANLERIGTYL